MPKIAEFSWAKLEYSTGGSGGTGGLVLTTAVRLKVFGTKHMLNNLHY